MAEDEDPKIISRIERKKAESERQVIDSKKDYGKYAVGGESTEVPASSVGENDNSIHAGEDINSKRKNR